MPRIIWGFGDRLYEMGLSRGVLYVSGSSGVAWPGLISLEEKSAGGSLTSLVMDEVPYYSHVSQSNYGGTLSAYSAPYEFGECLGEKELRKGFSLTNQDKKEFGLSYRTEYGSGYKIHLVYNATATKNTVPRKTQEKNSSPLIFKWTIDTVPVEVVNPPNSFQSFISSHIVLDTKKFSLGTLSEIEAILYGTYDSSPRLPTPQELIQLWGS